jgi:hypothetical protein
MNQLLGHDVARGPSHLSCAIEPGYADRKTRDGRLRCGSLSCGQLAREVDLVCQSLASAEAGQRVVLMDVSPSPFRLLLGHCFGANATPGGAAPFCFPDSSPRTSLGPSSRKHGLALGSRAHSHGFAQV